MELELGSLPPVDLETALQDAAEGEVVVQIVDAAGETYILLYQEVHKPPELPTAAVVKERWQNIGYLACSAFGKVVCTATQSNGKTILQATGTRPRWSSGSIPFIFKKSDDPVVTALLEK